MGKDEKAQHQLQYGLNTQLPLFAQPRGLFAEADRDVFLGKLIKTRAYCHPDGQTGGYHRH